MKSPAKKILVIEDDRGLRRAITFMLTHGGYTVVFGQDGEDGLLQAKEEMPDLILLDLMIPKVNGFEVLRCLKENPLTKPIPVVVFSNLSQDTDRDQVLKLGAVDFVIKSDISVEQILGIVAKYLTK